MNLLIESQYFPPLIFFLRLNESLHVIFEQYEHFQKLSFRNRCILSGPNGLVNLSVPLVGGRNQKLLTKDVLIDCREDWQSRHFKTICSCYNRSPWFDEYRDGLEELYQHKPERLIEWNLECLQWVCDRMAIKMQWNFTDGYSKTFPEQDYLDFRNLLKPANFGQAWTEEIQAYPQVFSDRHGFIPNLSILDYLFCKGNSFD